ncbi:hypothetical protein GCM10020295_08210 [Streptomyces cinereospinus]
MYEEGSCHSGEGRAGDVPPPQAAVAHISPPVSTGANTVRILRRARVMTANPFGPSDGYRYDAGRPANVRPGPAPWPPERTGPSPTWRGGVPRHLTAGPCPAAGDAWRPGTDAPRPLNGWTAHGR